MPATTHGSVPALDTDEAVALAIKAAVLEVEPGAEVILFGSRARGEATEESDWDLLVLVDGEVDWRRRDRLTRHLTDFEFATDWKFLIGALLRARQTWGHGLQAGPLYQNIAREGRLL